MKFIKWTIKIVLVLIVIVLLAVTVFALTFDANDYKEQIKEQVLQQTGRTMTIDGDISLSVFPWVGVEIGRVSISNAKGFSDKEFALMDALDVKIKLLPLIKAEVVIDTIRLRGLSVSLETDKEGNNNWSDLAQSPDQGSGETSTTETEETGTTTRDSDDTVPPALAGLVINGVEFVDAEFQWLDAKTDTKAVVSNLNLITGAIQFEEAIPVEFSAHIENNNPETVADISMAMNLSFNSDFSVIDAKDFVFKVTSTIKSISDEPLNVTLKSQAHVDLAKQLVELKQTQLLALGTSTNMDITVTELDSEPKVHVTVSTASFDAKEVAAKLNIELPPMTNTASLGAISFSSVINATSKQALVDDLKITVDQMQITGYAHVLDFEKLKVRYDLQMSPTDLNGYLPPPAEPVIENVENTAPAVDVEIVLPTELLRTLDLQGEFNATQIKVLDYTIEKLLVKTTVLNGVVLMSPVSIDVLEGNITNSVSVDVRGGKPAYTVSVLAKDLQASSAVDPVIEGLMGNKDVSVKGTVNFSTDIKTSGVKISELKKGLSGSLLFDMSQTDVNGLDIEFVMRNVIVDYLKEKKPDIPTDWKGDYKQKSQTAFTKIHASAKIKQGIVTNKDFIMDSKRLKVTGAGTINLPDSTMNYRTVLDLNRSQNKSFLEKLLNEPQAVNIKGPFSQVTIEFDKKQLGKAVANLLKAAIKKKAKKKIDAKKKKATDKVKNKLKDKFKKFF